MYTHILKFVAIKKLCLIIHIFSMYTHILKIVIKKSNYANSKTHIFYVYPYL